MIKGYNLVPWERLTLSIEEAKQLLKDHYTYGWTFQAYYIPQDHVHKKAIGMNLLIGLNYYQ
jgi:hypothetical protein